MAKRKSLSKKIRFEVFKRDSFTCQYCGRKAKLKDLCKEVRNWTRFREYWESLCGGDGDGN